MSINPDNRHVGRKAGIIGVWTFASRLSGFARDIAIAYVFGTGLAADAFFVAYRIPNLLRRLFAEGALTVAFVPAFTRSLKESKEEANTVLSLTMTLLGSLVTAVAIAGIFLSPWIVRLTAFGFTHDPEKFALTVLLTRWAFPFIVLISLAAVTMGVLNSLQHFWASAASPLLHNCGIILGALIVSRFIHPPILGLVIGVLGGGLIQLAFQFVPMVRYGFRPRWQWGFRHPQVQKIIRTMIPAAYGAAVYQFNVMAITFFASFLAAGSVSYLWYADRVMEFPLGIFGIAVATAILPTLSALAADQDMTTLKETLRYGLRLSTFINLPAMVGLLVLAGPIVELLFHRGTFSTEAVTATTAALRCFAIGIPFIAAVRITATAFYAMQDTKTPVKAATVTFAVTIILSLIFIGPFKHSGLALATSLAAMVNLCLHIHHLRKKIGLLGLKILIVPMLKVFAAAGSMGLVIGCLSTLVHHPYQKVGLVLVGAILYFTLATLFRCREVGEVWSLIRRHNPKPA